jgi:hypothetical protein
MPGALSQGTTSDEALANVAEAMAGWVEATIEGGGSPLDETPQLIAAEVAFVLGFRVAEEWPLTVETAEVDIQIAVPV